MSRGAEPMRTRVTMHSGHTQGRQEPGEGVMGKESRMLGTRGLHPWAMEESALLLSPHLPARPPRAAPAAGHSPGSPGAADVQTQTRRLLSHYEAALHSPQGGRWALYSGGSISTQCIPTVSTAHLTARAGTPIPSSPS